MGAETVKVREDNLYSNGKVIVFDSDERILTRDVIDYTPKETYRFHLLKSSDELTKLAGTFYGGFVINPGKYWWVIADANNINNHLDLETLVGTEIIIPDLLSLKLEL